MLLLPSESARKTAPRSYELIKASKKHSVGAIPPESPGGWSNPDLDLARGAWVSACVGPEILKFPAEGHPQAPIFDNKPRRAPRFFSAPIRRVWAVCDPRPVPPRSARAVWRRFRAPENPGAPGCITPSGLAPGQACSAPRTARQAGKCANDFVGIAASTPRRPERSSRRLSSRR